MGIMAVLTALMGTSCSKKTIHVEFVNGKDQTIIGVSEMEPHRLPDTFAVETQLDLTGRKWSVYSAEPVNKEDFIKSGTLRVVLWPIEKINAQDLLFSLPTISNEIGTVQGDAIPDDQTLALHEDDWRQVEFVSRSLAADVEKECADIRQIYATQRGGVGFKKVHVRKRIPEPLQDKSITLQTLEAALKPIRKYDGLGFQRTRGTVPGGFAWQLDGGVVAWGVADAGGKVVCLCLAGKPTTANVATLSATLSALGTTQGVDLVDWCRATSVKPDAQAFSAYFGDNP